MTDVLNWFPGKSGLLLQADWADDMGLVGVGGDLHPRRILEAYRRGIFPWFDEDSPICWWSPDPRAIFELGPIHVSRRLLRTMNTGRFAITVNRAFASVIRGCAEREEGTWITADMMEAYEALHHLRYAHSVEVWRANELVGGLYGVAIGGFFAGESMFHRCRDASKIALVFALQHLRRLGFQLFDSQFLTEHTARMGAIEIPRDEYLQRLGKALAVRISFA